MNKKNCTYSLLLTVMLVCIWNDPAWSIFAPNTVQKFEADDAASGTGFGEAISISNDTAIVGARFNLGNGQYSGAAYIYINSGGNWEQQEKLIAPDAATQDYFGHAVAIDGDTAVVAASDDDMGVDSGSVYVFTRSGTTWTYQEKLTASDGVQYDRFGHAVAISGDTLVIAARDDDDLGTNSGSVYIFIRTGTSWSQQAKLTPSVSNTYAGFGSSVSIEGDTVVVGSGGTYCQGTTNPCGAAFVFVRSGTTWSQQQKLISSDLSTYDGFGSYVSISGDTVLASAYGNDDAGEVSGSAYIFTRSGTFWSQQAKLVASDAAAGDIFSLEVSLFNDSAVIGARQDDDLGDSSGSVYIFVRSGNSWVEQTKLTAFDGEANDHFGIAAISGDTVLVSAVGTGIGGAVYSYNPGFTVGGTVSGLATGNDLVLQNNSEDNKGVSSNDNYVFPTALGDGSNYDVSVITQPSGPNQECTVSSGSGTIAGADVNDVSITCVTTYTYAVGGTVSGLASGNSVVLQNNGGDDLTVSADGSYSFMTLLADGAAYNVSVLTQPDTPDQLCTVSNSSGSSTGVDVNNISVSCLYAVNATVDAHGSLNAPSAFVSQNSTASFTITPDPDYIPNSTVTGDCPAGTWNNNIYTTGAITTGCTVNFTTSPVVTVTPSAGLNGTISPDTAQDVAQGSTPEFTVTPDTGYAAYVGGSCGGTLIGNIFTTEAVTADCSVEAIFTLQGDINWDGSVDLADTILVLQIITGTTTTYPLIDINGDGKTGLAEALYSLQQAGIL